MKDRKISSIHLFFSMFLVFVLLFVTPASAQKIPENILSKIHYRELGPTRQGGRVVAFAVSRQDPYVYFVGAGPGGLWKTVNNGTTFESVFDKENTSTIGDVAVAPSDHNIVWVGTGEANLRNSTYYGDGVYKSTDGGKTWTHMGLKESHHIGRVIIHPKNPNVVYVAAQGHYYTDNPERGVYKTIDGGKIWTKSLEVVVDGIYVGATDMVMDPRNPDILYASTYHRIRKPWGFSGSGPGSGIYKTTDGGQTWQKLTNGLPKGLFGKIGLAIYPKNPDILYTIIEDENSPEMSYEERWEEIQNGKEPSKPIVGNIVYRTDNAGESWQQVSEGNVGERMNYYARIFVDPNDENMVYVMGAQVDKSTDGGKTWSRAFEYAGDNHVLWINPKDSKHMLLGYDYGFAISYDLGKNWLHIDNVSMAQLYAIGVDMDYPYNVYGGMQDFGSWKGPSTKKGRFPIRFEDWEHVLGGDGFYNQVDPTNSRWLYTESQFGGLSRNDQKTGQRKRIRNRGNRNLRFNWNAPVLISPHNPNVIYQGANILLKSPFRGERWEEVSPDLTKNDASKFDGREVRFYGTITTIDESPIEQGVIWVGTDDGNVQITRDGGKTWTLLNDNIPNNPEYWVTRIVASHHDPGTAYVTITGRHRTDFHPYVYQTSDFGNTWLSIANNLPDEGINVIKEDRKNPGLLFIGTDRTVYVTMDRGKTWSEMKNNLPTIPVTDLAIHPRENDLVIGTFGRGFYIADISVFQELSQDVLTKDAHLFKIEPKVQWVMPSQKTVSAQNFEGENEPFGVVINYYLKKPQPEGVKISVYDGSILINELIGSGEAGLNSVEWGMTKRGRKRTPEEIARWDEQVAKGEKEPFYDYYDTNEYYGEADEEVGRTGLSLRTRVAWEPGMRGREYVFKRVQPGEFTIKLLVGDKILTGKSLILQDFWYDKKYTP
jgi:photosystem II stability/assembly factor-like uncharacterized protein